MTQENFKSGQINQNVNEDRKRDSYVDLSFYTEVNLEIKGFGLCNVKESHCDPSEAIDVFYDAASTGIGPGEAHEQHQLLEVGQYRVGSMDTLEDSLLGCGVESVVCPDSADQTYMHDMSETSSDSNNTLVAEAGELNTIEPSKSTYEVSVLRQINGCPGIYINGSVQGVDVVWTTDTGATRSIISKRVFDKIHQSKKPKLMKSNSLTSVSGEPLIEYGEAIFEIYLDHEVFEGELIVAEIEDQALLGLDILLRPENGPVKISLSENTLSFRGKEIEFKQSIERTRKVVVAENFVVPAYSEKHIDVFIDRFDSDNSLSCSIFCVEPTTDFNNRFPLLMASCLIDMENKVSAKIRVLNPFNTETNIEQDTVIGNAQFVDPIDIVEILPSERQLLSNSEQVRRVETNNSDKGDNSSESTVPDHLSELYGRAIESKTEIECNQISDLLCKFQRVFSQNDTDLGVANLVQHEIDTGDAKPIRQPPRRVPLAFADEEQKVVKQMMEQGIIRKSTSPWASPIVLVKKKNGKTRCCIDYRRLNAVTRQDAFPLPRVQDCIDTVRGSVYFSTFDLTSGYHQVPVKEEDIPKTAFITKYGLYEFTTMPMGLSTACATFQRLMELVLQGLNWQTCIIYLDDIVVFGSSFQEHLQRVKDVLTKIRESGMKLKPEKCNLFQTSVTFLGHVVSAEGVLPNPDNIAKILQWPRPSTVTEVRQLIGMGSYYRKFIKGFASLVRPLVELTKKERSFIWTTDCEKAFNELKVLFASPEILAYPLDEGEYILDTDASDLAIGGVLSQIQNGKERVIAYGSRSLNKSEKNYCITDKELLALRYFIEYFRQYLLGRRFTVRTDHQALVWLFKLKEPKGRIARWLEILSYFNFSVQYRPGLKHNNAGALSRCDNPSDCRCPETDNLEYLKCGPCKKCIKRASDMQSAFLQMCKMKVSNVVTDESSAQQVPEITRAVKTLGERKKSELGYSSIWEKYNRDQVQKALWQRTLKKLRTLKNFFKVR